MTEKEIEEYIDRKIKEIKKETECEDCILFIGKDRIGEVRATIANEEALVSNIKMMIRTYGKLGENPGKRQAALLGALALNFANEIRDAISKEAADDPSVEK